MKPFLVESILAAIMTTVAMAQTPSQTPAAPPPAPTYAPPQQAAPTAPADQGTSARNPRIDPQADVNDCTARVKAANPRLSAVEVKQYCEKDLNPSSPQD